QSAPFNDARCAGDRIAEVTLLENFIRSGAGATVGNKLAGGEAGAAHAVNDVQQAHLHGMRHGDAVVKVPSAFARARLLSEEVKESVLPVMRGPNGQVKPPSDSALGGFPEQTGIGMLGEFVEADISAIDGHSLWMGGKGEDAGFIIEFDVTDFDLFGEGSGLPLRVEPRDF